LTLQVAHKSDQNLLRKIIICLSFAQVDQARAGRQTALGFFHLLFFTPPETLMKIQFTVTSRKPRNPLVAAAKFRSAGSHQMSAGAMRQGNNQSLRRELDQLERRPKPT
jgi:hypothetical protein